MAATGAAIGALLGLWLRPFPLFEPLVSGVVLTVLGLLIGALLGLLGRLAHAAQPRQPYFLSASALRADRYEVLVTEDRADEVVRLLEGMPARR